jgi:hypothetical protein
MLTMTASSMGIRASNREGMNKTSPPNPTCSKKARVKQINQR